MTEAPILKFLSSYERLIETGRKKTTWRLAQLGKNCGIRSWQHHAPTREDLLSVAPLHLGHKTMAHNGDAALSVPVEPFGRFDWDIWRSGEGGRSVVRPIWERGDIVKTSGGLELLIESVAVKRLSKANNKTAYADGFPRLNEFLDAWDLHYPHTAQTDPWAWVLRFRLRQGGQNG